jgi:chromosome segregation ATPase
MMVQAPKEQAQYDKQINHLQEALRRSRDLRSRALSQKELLEQQREKLYQKAAEFGVKPEELEQKIAALKEEMDRLLAEANGLIPWDLLKEQGP